MAARAIGSILPEGDDMGFFNWAAPLVRIYGNRFDADDAERIGSLLRPSVAPGGRILDVGGGAGQLAHLLAGALDAHVTVLDPTPQMLDHVASDERVSAVQGVAEALTFPADSFDAVVVTDAFHHFRDQAGAAREFARVVRHGGSVLVLDLDPSGFFMRLLVLGEKLLGEPGAFMTPREMCEFMAANGIDGECAKEGGASYRYLGRVRKG